MNSINIHTSNVYMIAIYVRSAESLVQVAPMTDEDLKKTIRSRLALENRQITDYQVNKPIPKQTNPRPSTIDSISC